MAERPVARAMADLGRDLGPLMSFLSDSTWAKRRGEPSACDFVAGNPHDMPLPGIAEALHRWADPKDKDWFAYKLNEDPGRATVAASLARHCEITVEPEDVFLTPGTFGGIAVALRAILDPGDEVIFLSPPWFFYEAMIRIAGGTPVRVTLQPPSFDLDVDAIADACTERTRAVLVNSPNNPSGRIYDRATLDGLGRALRDASERTGRTIYLLSDEAYRRILFDGRSFVPPAPSYDATMILYTYGKTLLAPGERIGYIALPRAMPERPTLRNALLLSQITGGWQFPNATLQYALADLEPLSVDIPRLQARRDRVVDGLRDAGYEIERPDATFYLLPRAPTPDDGAFTEALAARDVFVLPGWAVELPGFVRLSITANEEMIERALPVFSELSRA